MGKKKDPEDFLCFFLFVMMMIKLDIVSGFHLWQQELMIINVCQVNQFISVSHGQHKSPIIRRVEDHAVLISKQYASVLSCRCSIQVKDSSSALEFLIQVF